MSVPVLAIDGPTGSGKGTASRALARRLGWHLLDSGALYRLVALSARLEGVDVEDPEALAAVARRMEVAFSAADESETARLNGEDVTQLLRTEDCGALASEVASLPAVREALLARQQQFAVPPGLVADGRDMGSVVFPNATLKVFLTASARVRAERRYNQLKEKGIDVSLPDLSREIARRDERDANRQIAPLKPADDARVLDSTTLSPVQVVARIEGWLGEMGVAAAQREGPGQDAGAMMD